MASDLETGRRNSAGDIVIVAEEDDDEEVDAEYPPQPHTVSVEDGGDTGIVVVTGGSGGSPKTHDLQTVDEDEPVTTAAEAFLPDVTSERDSGGATSDGIIDVLKVKEGSKKQETLEKLEEVVTEAVFNEPMSDTTTSTIIAIPDEDVKEDGKIDGEIPLEDEVMDSVAVREARYDELCKKVSQLRKYTYKEGKCKVTIKCATQVDRLDGSSSVVVFSFVFLHSFWVKLSREVRYSYKVIKC